MGKNKTILENKNNIKLLKYSRFINRTILTKLKLKRKKCEKKFKIMHVNNKLVLPVIH